MSLCRTFRLLKHNCGSSLNLPLSLTITGPSLDNLNKASVFGLRITMEGDVALVKIRGKDKTAFKMAKSSEGHWRIIAFNLRELTAYGGK